MTYYDNVYLSHLRLVKNNFPVRPGEVQIIYRKLTVNLLDKYFFKIIKQLGVNEFYECGAHEASASILFLQLAKSYSTTGKAIAIEANPHTYKEKTLITQKFGVETYNLALGAKEGEINIHIQSNNLTSGSTSLLAKVKNEKFDYATVNSSTIDRIYKLNSSRISPTAFWIDVEGFGFEVLKGGYETFKEKNVKIIKIELEKKAIWKNQKLASDVNHLFLSYGYLPILFDFERENQHNCVYIRREHISDVKNLISEHHRDLNNLKLTSWEYFYHTCRDFLHSKIIIIGT